MVRTLGFLAEFVMLAGCASQPATLPTPPAATQAGVLEFETAGGLQRSGLRGEHTTAAPARISGELRFPEGQGPFPAVVLAHGCNGNRGVEPAWGAQLRSWGYATFVLDSFGGRGLREVSTLMTSDAKWYHCAYDRMRINET